MPQKIFAAIKNTCNIFRQVIELLREAAKQGRSGRDGVSSTTTTCVGTQLRQHLQTRAKTRRHSVYSIRDIPTVFKLLVAPENFS
jgi:hypothetical protein